METLIKLILAVLLVVLGLVGCTSDQKLQAEISSLNLEVTDLQDKLKRTREGQEFYESQAGVYRGCKWLVNICPHSILVNAEVGMEKGYGGGASLWYWFIILFKIFVVASVLAGFWVLIVKWSLPVLAEGERVQNMLHNSDQRLQENEYRISELKKEISELEDKRGEQLAGIRAEIAAEQDKLTRLKANQAEELANFQAAKRALDLF